MKRITKETIKSAQLALRENEPRPLWRMCCVAVSIEPPETEAAFESEYLKHPGIAHIYAEALKAIDRGELRLFANLTEAEISDTEHWIGTRK